MYVPLRVHGWHSLLTGVDSPATLLERGRELGFPALAFCDVDTLCGSTEVLRAAEQAGDGAPRPILGAEISDPSGRPGRLIALVRDETGYRNLCQLVSARQLDEAFDLIAAASRLRDGLFFLVDHPRLIFALGERLAAEQLGVAISPAALKKRCGRRAGERVTQDARVELLAAPKVPPPSQTVAAEELVASARAVGIATLAVPDVYWARPEGYAHHRVRVAIKHNALRCDLPAAWLAERPGHLLSAAEMQVLFADLPDALRRTLEVAESCTFVPPLGGVLFPEIELDENETAYSLLCGLAFDGARRRYVPLRPEVVRRLDYELSAIAEMGYATYFLLVKKIADFACAKGIPHVGRGSAADSLVAYCLELTDADPLRYKLPFERFLNPARKDRPDIDLDFCWRRRDEVIAHVWEAFGAERTAMISTLNRFGLRSAFREAALAEGIPPVEVNRWSRRLPYMPHRHGQPGAAFDGSADAEPPALHLAPRLAANPVARAFASTPECRHFPFDDERYGFVLQVAAALFDAPRHLGLHPGGVVVAPGPISDVVSCQRATKGVVMTQLDKDGVEAIGLVKMDLLGNRSLTVLDDCLNMLDEPPDLHALAEDDPRTARLLAHGLTLGCFQVESPGMRNLLQQIGARDMDDVIQAVALIRPGPAGSGMKDAYIRRFRGLEQPHAPHPRLTELLFETHGIMLYQEDVMQAVALMAGFDLSTADQLRRALAKRRGDELDRLRRRFFEGCQHEGIASGDARRVWELIANFSSFGFCKAHAVTYGRIAYRAVYLKAHHPAAYMTAFLNSQTGYYETRVYVEEARRLGAAILPPDINRSQAGFTLEDGGIRVGLERVRGLSTTTREAILRGRAEGQPYLSLPDFLARVPARKDETEHLIQCGAFDAFDRTRPEMLWRLHLLNTPARRPPRDLTQDAALDANLLAACRTTPAERERESTGGWAQRSGLGIGGLPLAPGESATLFPTPKTPALALPSLPELDATTRGRLELELLGVTISSHPSELFPCAGDAHTKKNQRTLPVIPCGTLAAHKGSRVSLRGWLAASRRVRTADDRWMRFLTLEDPSGLAEVVLFADTYERHGHKLTHRGPFLISGQVEDQLGACTLHAEHLW